MANQSPQPFRAIYFGAPAFAGQLFGATKIPSLILIAGLLGLPLMSSIGLVTYARLYHSSLPVDLLSVGYLQAKAHSDPTALSNLPPTLDAAWKRTTPEQKQTGLAIWESFSMIIFVLVIALFWWAIAALRFVAKKFAQ